MKKYFTEAASEEYLKLLSNTAAISVIFGIGFSLWRRSENDFTTVKVFIIATILIMAAVGAWINATNFIRRSLVIPEEFRSQNHCNEAPSNLTTFFQNLKTISKKYKGLPLAILLCGIPLYMSVIAALSLGVIQAIG